MQLFITVYIQVYEDFTIIDLFTFLSKILFTLFSAGQAPFDTRYQMSFKLSVPGLTNELFTTLRLSERFVARVIYIKYTCLSVC